MESIGRKFREAREAKGTTLSQAASATRIKFQHLESMERDDFSKMAAAAYARGFIKIYAEYLELSPEPLIRLYMQEHSEDAGDRHHITEKEKNKAIATGGDKEPKEKTQMWSNVSFDTGLVKRVVIPAIIIVVAVLLLVSLSKLIGSRPSERKAPPSITTDRGGAQRIKDPPDIYLEIQRSEEAP